MNDRSKLDKPELPLLATLLGRKPQADADAVLNFETGRYQVAGSWRRHDGDEAFALALGERVRESLNDYLDMIGGTNANVVSPTIRIGHLKDRIFAMVAKPEGGWNEHQGTADQVVEAAVLEAIRRIKVEGGDLHLKRAVQNSEADTLEAFDADMKTAGEYARYLKNKPVADGLIARDPHSDFAIQMRGTLTRAKELKLDDGSPSDFDGGLKGYLRSMGIEGIGLGSGDVRIALDGAALTVEMMTADGTVAKTVTIPDAMRAFGLEVVQTPDVRGEAAAGSGGRDLWIAPGRAGYRFGDGRAFDREGSDDVLAGGGGPDDIRSGGGADFAAAGSGRDKMILGWGDDVGYGGDDDDEMWGDEVPGSEIWWAAAKHFRSGEKGVLFQGADRNDGTGRSWFGVDPGRPVAAKSDRDPVVRWPEGADELHGGRGRDSLYGGGGTDWLYGGPGEDRLDGGPGDDFLEGGAGADALEGGAGFDTASFADRPRRVTVDLRTGRSSDGDRLTSIEDLVGSRYNDRLSGDDGPNMFDGRGGSDAIDGRGGIDTVSYASAPRAVEVDLAAGTGGLRSGGWERERDALTSIEGVIGSRFGDVLRAGPGTTSMKGGPGDDLFTGVPDDLAVRNGRTETTVDGGPGFDTVSYWASPRGIVLDTGAKGSGRFESIDQVLGSRFGDRITTHDGTQVLKGGPGTDILRGGEGTDIYMFYRGDGRDMIEDAGGERDAIAFGSGIAPEDLQVRRGTAGEAWERTGFSADGQGRDILVEIFGPRGGVTARDRIVIKDGATPEGRIEEVRFASGVIHTIDELMEPAPDAGSGALAADAEWGNPWV